MQLRLSLHEVITKSTQALRALNIPSGLDIENGKNIGWLATRGLPGLQMLFEEITTSYNTPDRSSIKINIVKDIVQFSNRGCSAFYFAQSAVDFAENGNIVSIGTCKFPLLIFAEMARREHLPFGFQIEWSFGGKLNKGFCMPEGSQIEFHSASLMAADNLKIIRVENFVASKLAKMRKPKKLSIATGISTNKQKWETILRTAKNVLVADSQQSHSSAGAEVDDNL